MGTPGYNKVGEITLFMGALHFKASFARPFLPRLVLKAPGFNKTIPNAIALGRHFVFIIDLFKGVLRFKTVPPTGVGAPPPPRPTRSGSASAQRPLPPSPRTA